MLKQQAAARADPAPRETPRGQGTVHPPLDLDARDPAPVPARVPERAAPQATAAAPAQQLALVVETRDGEIVARIGPCAATLARADAARLAKVLVDMISA